MSSSRLVLEIAAQASWEAVERLRNAVWVSFHALTDSDDCCDSVAMAVAELLENAVKYGAWDDAPTDLMELTVRASKGKFHVEVSNPATVGSDNLNTLQHLIDTVHQETNAQDLYRSRVAKIASQVGVEGPSQLGILRIAHEGGCRLSCRIENGKLTMVADGELPE